MLKRLKKKLSQFNEVLQKPWYLWDPQVLEEEFNSANIIYYSFSTWQHSLSYRGTFPSDGNMATS